jgi:hypothetical protein
MKVGLVKSTVVVLTIAAESLSMIHAAASAQPFAMVPSGSVARLTAVDAPPAKSLAL